MTTSSPQPINGADPVEVIGRVAQLANELELLSDTLMQQERKREPLAKWYEDAIAAYEVKLWAVHVDTEMNVKWPAESVREKIARSELDQDVLSRFEKLTASRARMEQRIRDIKVEIDAWRSVLSALKTMGEVQ